MAYHYGLDKPLLCSIVTNQTTNMLPENFSLGVGEHLFIVLIFLNKKTLANQELGHTPWPLASLSQGDLLRKALRFETLD